jgi:protein ImuB
MRFEETLELDGEILDLESLAFVVRGLAERLVARLSCRGLAACELELRLQLDPRGVHELRVPLRAPTRQVATMTTLVRLAAAEHPPDRAVRGVTLCATPAAPRSDQLCLFEPLPPRPDEIAATVARIAAVVGPNRVGSPVELDSHRPGAQTLREFDPPRETRAPSDKSAAAFTPVEARKPMVALRWLLPVDEDDALSKVAGMRVIAAAGPWRVSAEWWESTFDRDFYAVRTNGGDIYLVARNGAGWQRVGMFD